MNRSIILLSFVSFFTDIASEMLYPVLPIYLKEIGFTMVMIGALEGFSDALSGYAKGYFGSLSDRLGKRAVFVRIGYFLSTFSKPLVGLFPTPFLVFLFRLMDRLGKGIRTAPRDALLIENSLPENRGKVFGFHRGMDTLGAFFGPIIAFLFIYFYPGQYTTLFLICFIPGIMAIALTLFIADKGNKLRSDFQKNETTNYFFFWKEASPEFKIILIGSVVLAFFNSSDVFLLLKAKEDGLEDSKVILLYIFYNFIYAISAYPSGLLADKISFKKIILLGLIFYSAAYFLMANHFSEGFVWLAFGIYGLFSASTEGIFKAWLSMYIPKEKIATGLGFYMSISTFAIFIASPLTGLLWTMGSSSLPFYVISINGLLVFLFFLFQKKI
ncbi:MAG: MFS transporter [Leptospiraceae bacterium]|nr:MFS transporter [Leptospiraceae bacterium]